MQNKISKQDILKLKYILETDNAARFKVIDSIAIFLMLLFAIIIIFSKNIFPYFQVIFIIICLVLAGVAASLRFLNNEKISSGVIASLAISSIWLSAICGILNSISFISVLWPLIFATRMKTNYVAAITVCIISAIFAITLHNNWNLRDDNANFWGGLISLSFTIYGIAGYLIKNFEIKANLKKIRNRRPLSDNRNNKNEFIAEMSHEIRTPLNAILGFSDTMREGVFGPLPDQYKEYAELIHKSGSHLLELISDILDMSKIEAGKYILEKKQINLYNVVSGALDISKGMANNYGVEIVLHGAKDYVINADERSLRQIIFNIVSNAIKFTKQGGKIITRIFASEDKIFLEILDQGAGMSEETLKRIGEPYLKGDNNSQYARSTGLGLALVKKLVQLNGGSFDIVSEINKGTRVVMSFDKAK